MTLLFILAGLLGLVMFWGPGHHLEFAERVCRRRRELLPASVARLLSEEKEAFLYGNLAADIINMKGFGGHFNHCHRWTIIEDMRAQATTPREEAFISGYLSHLAADTIAHNHYVPYHLTRFARTRGFGHLYWEMAADRMVPEARWEIITRLKDSPELASLDELINSAVPKKAISMGANKLIFNHVLLVSERRQWRNGVEALHPIAKVSLKKGFLGIFQKAAVNRVRLALHPKGVSKLQHIDTTGKAAQREAMKRRKQLVSRFRSGNARDTQALELAQPFLEGMQSPPASGKGAIPHW